MKTVLSAMLAVSSANAMVSHAPDLLPGWRESSMLGASQQQPVSFTIAVKEINSDEVKRVVERVSDPKSSEYGKYLSSAEILKLTEPKAEDVDAVLSWLSKTPQVESEVVNGRTILVTAPMAAVEKLLQTEFRNLVNTNTHQKVFRAGAYTIPDEVNSAIAGVFGLHGLPLPKQPIVSSSNDPGNPASVTPKVLYDTYSIGGVTPSGSNTNRQAVAEFQGQYEKDSDLAQFFKSYVPNAQPGDEKVSKFVGSKDQQEAGVEASLDIQYIMGVAPHIKTEFWLFAGNDFCLDLQNWTSTMLADDQAPYVHSVSYGWQGNLTQIGCTDAEVNVVDANFAKLASKGITIIFASGDSGSGYTPSRPICSTTMNDKAFMGPVGFHSKTPSAEQCCTVASERGFSSWTYTPPGSGPRPGLKCNSPHPGTEGEVYVGTPSQNISLPAGMDSFCCEIAMDGGPWFTSYEGEKQNYCALYHEQPTQTKKIKGAYSGRAQAQYMGNCTGYAKPTGSTAANGATSGTAKAPSTVQLWPSWPASSPYVTSVGATRFVDQTVGQPEMATDQFGSGGGFSSMFKQQTDAKWQMDAVAHYVNNPPNDPHYPPAGSFDPKGRATPDVSALGEGYQVVANGAVEPVGGTSASAPAFAGMVALLNEARAQKGKKQLGFLNPFLYQNADCFTDVTRGTNAIGRGTGPVRYGFNATAGWDPATGLGTPAFQKLLEAATAAN